jgi:mono/diheme cytochrome c family protein
VSRVRTMTGLIRLTLIGAVLLLGVACRSEQRTMARYEVGRPATPAEIAAWNIDVNPSGEGLPAGRGTVEEGARVFAANCAGCHGARGEGLPAGGPALVGRDPREGFPFGESLKYVRTVGNYWPYATTLYDYINRTMPATTPGSLAPDEIYAVVAWILAQNEIISPTAVIDAASLPRVRMPARDRFVPDDRYGEQSSARRSRDR